MNDHEKLNYVELPARDLGATKQFFGDAFGWTFEDYGPEYAAFANEGLRARGSGRPSEHRAAIEGLILRVCCGCVSHTIFKRSQHRH